MKETAEHPQSKALVLLKKIAGFFTKDPVLKLGAVLISVMVWFIVMNVTDPIEKRSYTVNLSLVNDNALPGAKKMLLNGDSLEGTMVTITLEGARSAFNAIDRSKITAYVDFKIAEILNAPQVGEPLATSVIAGLGPELADKGLVVSSYSPRTVDIILDDIVVTSKIITKSPIGEVADGFVCKSVAIAPEAVRITGPQMTISKIGSVRVEYNLTDLKASTQEVVALKIYDNRNEEFKDDGLTLSAEFVTVSIEICPKAVKSIEIPTTTGEVMEGYRVTGVEYSPKMVEVVGSQEELDALKSFVLDPIDISGIYETQEYSFDIRSKIINTGLSEAPNQDYNVSVTISVEKVIEREFAKPVSEINLSGISNNIEISTETVYVTVRGIASVINGLTNEDVSAKVALNNLEPGEYEIPVTFSLPYKPGAAKIEIVSEPAFITVVVREFPINGEGEALPDGEDEPPSDGSPAAD